MDESSIEKPSVADAPPLARRSFIKDSGLMIAGGAIGGAIAVGKAVHGGKSAPIKIAIVGCGRRGRELADATLAVPGESVQIVALADGPRAKYP